ncbi:PREDICTED: uncharacterized protein LOC105524730 [Colobus angolensis palliatus]|uniref:uncharacterized protein LOC105524730 n=1 Tax=Colobus angolensis palliatus TaxID=336983 RepID=UPI0005F3F7B2|nr:PREDICTED: uncharacterized protein LOC105524730 [Colobus angolensis palliatus]
MGMKNPKESPSSLENVEKDKSQILPVVKNVCYRDFEDLSNENDDKVCFQTHFSANSAESNCAVCASDNLFLIEKTPTNDVDLHESPKVTQELVPRGGRASDGSQEEAINQWARRREQYKEGKRPSSAVGSLFASNITKESNSAAKEAGLQIGDVVLAVNGTEVTSVELAEAVNLAVKGTDILTLVVGSDISHRPSTPWPTCCGYLCKRTHSGIVKGWRKRWSMLKYDGCLYYYKHKKIFPVGHNA